LNEAGGFLEGEGERFLGEDIFSREEGVGDDGGAEGGGGGDVGDADCGVVEEMSVIGVDLGFGEELITAGCGAFGGAGSDGEDLEARIFVSL